MVLTLLKLSLRKLWNEKSFSLLSIAGLSLAIVSATTILLYTFYERSFDDFRSPDIYRVTYHGFENNVSTGSSAQINPALAPAIKNDIPEVKSAVRLVHTGPFMADPVMEYQDKKFRESKIYYADPEFLSMFSYNLIEGNVATALANPDHAVVSRSVATKYFGNGMAIGKTLVFHRGERGPQAIVISGVFEDIPLNSHLHTDFVLSFSSLGINDLDSNWDWGNFYTYIQLQPGLSAETIQAKIPLLLNKHLGKVISDMRANGYRAEFHLQPIQSIHLHSRLWGELEANGDATTITFLQIVAAFILLIAWINYINFSIARSTENSREISIRKINGASRIQLIGQLLTDAAAMNFIAIVISVAAIQATLPILKVMIDLPGAVTLGWQGIGVLVIIYLVGTLCSGLYPALFISRLSPVSLLKSKVSRSLASVNLNKALIIFQFTASVVLIIGTITVYQQLTFMRNQALGMDLEQTLIVKGPSVKDSTYKAVRSSFAIETKRLPGVVSFAITSSIPGDELHWGRSFARQNAPENSVESSIVAIDENFFTLLGATFASGKNYPDGTTAWQDAIIINETAAKALGYFDPAEAIDQTILWDENDRQIPKKVIGVVKDFNQQSLRTKIEPIVFTLREYVFAPWAGEFYAFKIQGKNIQESIRAIQQTWGTLYPQNPFDYFFLDQYFNAQYKNDDRFGKVFIVFSGLAIFIASLGLFGLTAYMTMLRTKEIGVRKVLGSTTFQLVYLLSVNYLKLVVVAFLIACPIGILLMTKWLSQFAYHTSFNIWICVVAGLLSLTIAGLTVAIKSWQSANIDPAKALKYE
jgi:putative ABC transport system permease protein